jgi:hypothetical protein
MESKPTGQKRHLILVPRTKRRDRKAPSSASSLASRHGSRAYLPAVASYPSRTRQAQAPDAARQYQKSASGCATLSLRRVYSLEKSNWREMEGSQRHTAGLESMEAERGKMARTRSKMPWVPKR